MLFDYLKSTLLSKVVMAFTGVILVLFLMGHCLGNMQIYIGPDAFNRYAHFLQNLGELLWIVRILLLFSLIFHVITSIRLKLLNYQAKGQKYRVTKFIKASLTSRTMIWTGILIFFFLTFHLMHFTAGRLDPENFSKNNPEYFKGDAVVVKRIAVNKNSGLSAEKCREIKKKCRSGELETKIDKEDCKDIICSEEGAYLLKEDAALFHRPDAWSMVVKGFKQPVYAFFYIIFVILMGFHLSHAIQSAFQTLGLNHPKYNNFFRKTGPVLSTILVLGYISIPVTIVSGLVGGHV